MRSFAVSYATDSAYLYPTLLSLASLRINNPEVPVYVLILDDGTQNLEELRAVVGALSAELIVAAGGDGLESDIDWSKSHVSPAALGRFALGNYLPQNVERFLYLDGDTEVLGDLHALLTKGLARKPLAAARDAMSLYTSDFSRNGRESRQYLRNLELDPRCPYYNSGVILTERSFWRDISKRALEYLHNFPERCKYHDQSALNAVLGENVAEISPRWNFQTRFKLWNSNPAFVPAILHFTGAMKPWSAQVHPWEAEHEVLMRLGKQFRSLEVPIRIPQRSEVEAHNAQFKTLRETVRRRVDIPRRLRSRRINRLHAQIEV